MPEEKKYTLPRDVFMHLLAIITLYIAAFSFGRLLFDYINRFFPDPLLYRDIHASGDMRWSIAALIVVFPVYFFLTRFLNREFAKRATNTEPRIRKWLIYFTLFASAVVIIIDLITLISTYLGGELTVRFLLKVIVVLFIAASIFRYYVWNLHMRKVAYIPILVGIVTCAIIATVIGGFFLVGSPTTERLRRFDERRTSDLQMLQNEIINYWLATNALPEDLKSLKNRQAINFINDPETEEMYEYKVLEPLNFELCGNFNTTNKEDVAQSQYVPPRPVFEKPYIADLNDWTHDAGRTCFTRTIDPNLYKKNE